MSPTKFLMATIRWMLAFLWVPTLALANVASMQQAAGPLVIDVFLAAVTFLVSSLCGGTTLAIRINTQLGADPEAKLIRPMLFCTAHMLGSWLAGVFAFLLGMLYTWPNAQTLVAVLVMSFAGSKGLEMAVERWLPIVSTGGGKP